MLLRRGGINGFSFNNLLSSLVGVETFYASRRRTTLQIVAYTIKMTNDDGVRSSSELIKDIFVAAVIMLSVRT